MGLEYRAQLEQKALRDLHRSFYIFATVIVFFAVLGFLFIVWYYNALAFTSNNTSPSDLSVSNTSAIKFGVHSARLLTYPNSPLGVVTQQNKGISRLMDYNNKVVWLFGESYINISTQGGFATTLKHNTVMLMDTNNTVAPVVYTDLLSSDNVVSSVVSIGASVYIFYSRQSNIYGIGKLSFSNNDTTILSMVEDNNDIGPIMSTLTPTHVLLYCQEDQLQVYWIPRPTFEEAVHNKQFWSYFKSLRSSPNRPFMFDALHDGGRKVEIYSVGHIFHSMEWNEYWLQFVVLSTLDNHLYVWHSKDEYGPFTSRLLLEIHPTIGGITQAHFHKELWRGGGKIMVLSYTYCTKGIGGSLSHLVEVEIVL